MIITDLVLDQAHIPTQEDVIGYIEEPGKRLWQDINLFLQQDFRLSPKIEYSVCSGKPGWNFKYKKSGKSVCTLYPEKQSFTALVVIKQDLREVVEGMPGLDDELQKIVREAAPFNGTLWLMIPVCRVPMLESVKELLRLKAGK